MIWVLRWALHARFHLSTSCLQHASLKWLMNLSIWAFGVNSQILNENLIGDLTKHHCIRSLVVVELYVSPPSRKEFGFQLHSEAPPQPTAEGEI